MFQKLSGMENFMERRRGGSEGVREGGSIKIFRRIFFVTSAEKFRRGETLVLLLSRVSKNVSCQREGIRIFRQKYLSLCQKFS